MSALTVVFALLCALSNAASTVFQRRAVEREDVEGRGLRASVRRLARPLRDAVWWAGAGAIVSAGLFQVLALDSGRLSVVQPLLASELLFTLLLGAAVFRRRPSPGTWRAFAMLAVGLAVFLGTASPSGGSEHASAARWVAVGAAVAAAVGSALLLARRVEGSVRAAVLGGATAAGFATTAALIKEVTAQFPGGVGQVFGSWPVYAAAAVGGLSMLLLQLTLRAGSLTASQPALTLGDALISVALGAVLFGEQIALGWWIVPELVGVGLIGVGVVGITRTPAVRNEEGWDQEPDEEAA